MKEAILNALRYRFNLDEDKANEEEIRESITRSAEFRGTNLWALIFAIITASIGLNVNSTAVIIGAMLISPLMGPIMGVGLGAGIFDFALIRYSLKNLTIATVISLVASALYFWLTPLKSAQSELLARISPTIWDVLIALFAGLAGIVASSRKYISNTIPGVAIATALMPPLCTAGYGIGTGNLYYFLGAFYLFVINSVFIAVATFLIIRFLKFQPVVLPNQAEERRVKRVIWSIAVLTILPSIFLAYKFVTQEIFKQNLRAFTHDVVEASSFYVIKETVRPGQKKVSWIVYGEKPLDTLEMLISRTKARYDLLDAEFEIRQASSKPTQPEDLPATRNETQLKLENSASLLLEKDKKIKSLEDENRAARLSDSTVYAEFSALFGAPVSISAGRIRPFSVNDSARQVLLLYVRGSRKLNKKQVENWLRARYPRDSTVFIYEYARK